MTDQTLTAARAVRDAFIGEHISRGHADETYLERVHGRDRYALVKPKAGGGRRDFEFANYPAFLIVARD